MSNLACKLRVLMLLRREGMGSPRIEPARGRPVHGREMLVPSSFLDGGGLMSGSNKTYLGHGDSSSESKKAANPRFWQVSNVPSGWQGSCLK